jgi:hypothetical protein
MGEIVAIIYTRDGEPINRSGNELYDSSGIQVGRMDGNKAFGPDGKYVATLVSGRLVYLRNDSAIRTSPFPPRRVAGFAVARVAGVAIYGDEPHFAHWARPLLSDSWMTFGPKERAGSLLIVLGFLVLT